MIRGDDFVVTWPAAKLIELKSIFAGVCPIKTNIMKHGSEENIEALNRRMLWVEKGLVCLHDRRHVDVSPCEWERGANPSSGRHDE